MKFDLEMKIFFVSSYNEKFKKHISYLYIYRSICLVSCNRHLFTPQYIKIIPDTQFIIYVTN